MYGISMLVTVSMRKENRGFVTGRRGLSVSCLTVSTAVTHMSTL